MGELRFSISLSSPAFLNSVAVGEGKTVNYLGRMRDGVRPEVTKTVSFYPIDPGGLRIPELRGLLEFWFRSIRGGLSSAEIFSSQARCFGSTQRGQGLTIRPCSQDGLCQGALEFRDNPYSKVYLGYGPLQLLRVPTPGNANGREIATSFYYACSRLKF